MERRGMTKLHRPVFKPKPQIERCDHEWKTEVIMVRPQDRTQKQVDHGMDYKGGRAAFKVKKCEKCKSTIYQDYKVERI